MNKHIVLPKEQIADFCRRWRIEELSIFGSALREDFRPDSDVDVLVRFSPEASWGLFDLMRMEEELKAIFGREVDLVERSAVEHSRNYVRRKAILNNLEPIYAA
ncbi:MAG: nucleotidyltransferase family protein [Anaerolineales bacterium]|nr:nucleotidyltransferase family protein [Anaerolineales bacterium]